MAHPKNLVPTYKKHPNSNEARCWVGGRWHTLGRHGSPESIAEFGRICAERRAAAAGTEAGSAPQNPPKSPGRSPTVNEVLLAFWQYAQVYYRDPDGRSTTEVKEYRYSLRPVRELYGHTPAAEFGPVALRAVRQRMIDAGLSRGVVNQRIGRVKRAFRWAASNELVPVAVYQSLATLAGLRCGRSAAPDTEEVKPADPAHVAAVLPLVRPPVRAMVELELLTGMRPGEVCRLTLDEVDRSGEPWVYRPTRHKTRHRGKARAVPIGPRARAVLDAYLVGERPPPAGFEDLTPDDMNRRLVAADAYQDAGRHRDAELLRDLARMFVVVAGCVVDPKAALFNPAADQQERFRSRRATRRTKVQPSQVSRRKADPKRKPADVYNPHALAVAVRRACEKAGVPHWHPNQLRHTFASEVRRRYGLEAAQALLGHARADVTQVYAERDLTLALRVAAEMG
jgi:integrase